MHFRWWNSFNLLGVILLAISVLGLFSGGHFVFDPGRAATGREWMIYATAGVLMFINGFLPPSHVPSSHDEERAKAGAK